MSAGVLGGSVDLKGGTVINAGVIEGAGGNFTIMGDVANADLAEAVLGHLTITGAVSRAGSPAGVRKRGAWRSTGPPARTSPSPAKSTGTVVLGDVTTTVNGFTGRIYGLATNGANDIDLKNLTFATGDTAQFTGSAVGGTRLIFNRPQRGPGQRQAQRPLPGLDLHRKGRRLRWHADHRSASDHRQALPGHCRVRVRWGGRGDIGHAHDRSANAACHGARLTGQLTPVSMARRTRSAVRLTPSLDLIWPQLLATVL